ncbi:MAG: aminotransferase class V-fold PLP-dependent enzyme [Clostridia bacterium]|nr:aminotransferase class V-fold PLP-dependent enzyme [Clostridia bacterium]
MEQRFAELKAQFPAAREHAFFDIAYENCGSDFAREAAAKYFADKAAIFPKMPKAGGAGKGATIGAVEECRAKLAAFLGAEGPRNIAFTANTCQAVSIALMALSYEPGDNIVVGDIEHVSVLMPCLKMRDRGVAVKVAKSRDGLRLTADELLAAVDDRTRIVAVSYVQSSSGYKLDLKHLTEECHRRGVLVVTDAIQALGVTPVDVKELGVDALAASGYKGLLALEGAGFLYASTAMLEQMTPVFSCWNAATGFDRATLEVTCNDVRDARKLEAGTLPFAAVYALSAGISRITELGKENVFARVAETLASVVTALGELGFETAYPFDPGVCSNSVLFKTAHNKEMTDFCAEHGVYFSEGKPGYVRVSVAPFNDAADVARLKAVAALWQQAERAL